MAFNKDNIKYSCKSFSDLTLTELYEILQLRQVVFIVEQDCPYLDCDGKDQQSHHVQAYLNDKLVAYTRLLPKGISYPNFSSIGRVVTHPDYRSTGLGKHLMEQSLYYMKSLMPSDTIKISSQCYAISFYEKFGFTAVGDEYLEDDIPHKAMILDIQNIHGI